MGASPGTGPEGIADRASAPLIASGQASAATRNADLPPPDDPTLLDWGMQRVAWWLWVAPESGYVLVHTWRTGSSNDDFSPEIYPRRRANTEPLIFDKETGQPVFPDTGYPRFGLYTMSNYSYAFPVLAGRTYEVAVGCYDQNEWDDYVVYVGDVRPGVNPSTPRPPGTDNFADRPRNADFTHGYLSSANGVFTMEPGEPLRWPGTEVSSAWWEITSPIDGLLCIMNSIGYKITAVFSGTSLDNLVERQYDEDYGYLHVPAKKNERLIIRCTQYSGAPNAVVSHMPSVTVLPYTVVDIPATNVRRVGSGTGELVGGPEALGTPDPASYLTLHSNGAFYLVDFPTTDLGGAYVLGIQLVSHAKSPNAGYASNWAGVRYTGFAGNGRLLKWSDIRPETTEKVVYAAYNSHLNVAQIQGEHPYANLADNFSFDMQSFGPAWEITYTYLALRVYLHGEIGEVLPEPFSGPTSMRRAFVG